MTLYTTNYNLDKYEGVDKPNLRDQYNSAMDKIDSTLKTQEEKQASDKQELSDKQNQDKNELSQKIDENKNDLNEKISQETEKRENADNQIKSDLEQANNDIADNSEKISKLENSNKRLFVPLELGSIPVSSFFYTTGFINGKLQPGHALRLIYTIDLTDKYDDTKYSPFFVYRFKLENSNNDSRNVLNSISFNQFITPTQLKVESVLINAGDSDVEFGENYYNGYALSHLSLMLIKREVL